MEAVLFDLDGTLLNRKASVERFIADQYERFKGRLGSVAKQSYCQRFIELDENGYVWKDKVYMRLVEEFNITKVTAETLLADYVTAFKEACIAFPNLLKLLDILQEKSIKLGMITNGLGQFQMNNIESLGIRDYFDTILISEWEGIKKPNPKLFKKALEILDVRPEAAMFVGDHPIADVLGAKNTGMVGVWKENQDTVDIGADYVIDDLLELIPILKC